MDRLDRSQLAIAAGLLIAALLAIWLTAQMALPVFLDGAMPTMAPP